MERSAKTSISVLVEDKYESRFLRYSERTGSVKNETRYTTVFKLSTGEILISYSKEHFARAVVGKSYDLKVSYCQMANGQYLLYTA